MAKMFGFFRPETQNSKGSITKASEKEDLRHEVENAILDRTKGCEEHYPQPSYMCDKCFES